jgi:hypothetical protein
MAKRRLVKLRFVLFRVPLFLRRTDLVGAVLACLFKKLTFVFIMIASMFAHLGVKWQKKQLELKIKANA